MKAVLRTAAALMLLVLALVTFVDMAVESGVERAAEAALEVDAELGNATLGTLSGRMGLDTLAIDNPPGFAAPSFLALARAEVDLAWTALVRDRVVVPELVLESLELDLERNGERSNYAALLEHLETRAGGEGDAKRFVVGRVLVHDLRVRIRSATAEEAASDVTLTLSRVVMRDPYGAGAARSLPQHVSAIVRGLLEAVLRTRPEDVPATLLADLEARLDEFQERVAVEVTPE